MIEIKELPFYWRTKETMDEEHGLIPENFPYKFELDQKNGLLRQCVSPSLKTILEEVYRAESNIGFLQDDHSLASGYGDDFLDFIMRSINHTAVKNVIEIGCGGCVLLEKLDKLGYFVKGVDPSPIATLKGKEKNITVVKEFFPTPLLNEKADLIFHVDVLEHIEDPVLFLSEQKLALTDDGILIVNVPDCTESIIKGDISIATHQHLNSFTVNSLRNVIREAGLGVLNIEKSGFGGSLYAVASQNSNLDKFIPEKSDDLYENFFTIAERNIKVFDELITSAQQAEKTIGFYMPLRSFPYISASGFDGNFRVFDDIQHWTGRFFDGVNIPIENFDGLILDPVDYLFIMSLTFGEQVKTKVLKYCPSVEVVKLDEILSMANERG